MSFAKAFDGSDAELLPRNAAECAEFLRKFNEWRRWDDDDKTSPEMPHPKEIGLAIDMAIGLIEQHVELLAAINRTYSVLLSDADTKSALTKAEDMLREAIAITKGTRNEKV